MDPAPLLAGLSRETTIRRDASGRWFHDGQELEHGNLTRAFDGWIGRGDDGRYCLRNDINWAYVHIEGPAYFVRAVQPAADGTLRLSLSGGLSAPLDESTLRQDAHGALYCDVLAERLPARFDSHAAAQLEPFVNQDAQGVYLELSSERVRPPVVDDPLAVR